MKFQFGDLVRERITGFEGVVLGTTTYATGCVHFGLMPRKLKPDGDIQDWVWFDQSRLDLVESGVVQFAVPERTMSGDFPNPPQVG